MRLTVTDVKQSCSQSKVDYKKYRQKLELNPELKGWLKRFTETIHGPTANVVRQIFMPNKCDIKSTTQQLIHKEKYYNTSTPTNIAIDG